MGNKFFSAAQKQNNISFKFAPNQMGQVITLVDANKHRLFTAYGLRDAIGWTNVQIIELYCTSDITSSIPEATPPVLDRADGEYANLQKTQDYLWKTSRLELELYSRIKGGIWNYFGTVPLKHNSGFRYRRHRLIDLLTDNVQAEFGEGGALGVKLANVGYGNLAAGDRISIIGSWIQEVVIIQEQLPYVTNTAYFTGTSSSGNGTTPPPTNETINEFNIQIPSQTVVLQPRATRTSLTITVTTPGFSGGFVGAWENNTWKSGFTSNPVNWDSSETGKIITDFTTWKGEVRANQAGFGDPEDTATLKITEKYTT